LRPVTGAKISAEQAREAAEVALQHLRAGAILLKQFKLFLPVQSCRQKYFDSRLTQITCISLAVSFHGGAVRDRHERGAGCGGRGLRY
jgi:hypothetical protein